MKLLLVVNYQNFQIYPTAVIGFKHVSTSSIIYYLVIKRVGIYRSELVLSGVSEGLSTNKAQESWGPWIE